MITSARRALLGTVLAGGVVAVTSESADAATFAASQLRADALKVGDVVLGPAGAAVRVSVVRRLTSGRVQLRYTDPATGASVPFDAATASVGHAATRRFVVLVRGVYASAVRHSAPPGSTPAQVIDGGAP